MQMSGVLIAVVVLIVLVVAFVLWRKESRATWKRLEPALKKLTAPAALLKPAWKTLSAPAAQLTPAWKKLTAPATRLTPAWVQVSPSLGDLTPAWRELTPTLIKYDPLTVESGIDSESINFDCNSPIVVKAAYGPSQSGSDCTSVDITGLVKKTPAGQDFEVVKNLAGKPCNGIRQAVVAYQCKDSFNARLGAARYGAARYGADAKYGALENAVAEDGESVRFGCSNPLVVGVAYGPQQGGSHCPAVDVTKTAQGIARETGQINVSSDLAPSVPCDTVRQASVMFQCL